MDEARDHKRRCTNDEVDEIGTDFQRKRPKNRSASPLKTPAKSSSGIQAVTTTKRRESSPFQDSHNQKTNSTKTLLSIFESLPAEILERIFLYSLNVNLPRASPYLAAAVSNELVYRLLILLAFWDNDEQYDDENRIKRVGDAISDDPARYEDIGTYSWRKNGMYVPWILRPLGHDYVPLTSCERRALQSDILQCKWCTIDRIRRQLPDLARLVITRWCVNAGYMLEEEVLGRAFQEQLYLEGKKTIRLVTKRTRKQPESKEGISAADKYPFCRFTLYNDESVEFIYNKVSEWRLADEVTREAHIIDFPLLSVKDIPARLLCADIHARQKGLERGYFTDTHLKFLETIRYSGLPTDTSKFMSIDTTYSLNALQQGIHVAITKIDPLTLEILLQIEFTMRRKYYHHNFPPACFRTAAQVYVDVVGHNNKDRYRYDLTYQEAEDDALLCFCLLLHSGIGILPFDDPIITKFAETVGGVFGKWLLDLISIFPRYFDGLADSDDEFHRHVVFRSRYSVDMQARYYDEVSDTREIFSLPLTWKFKRPS